MEKRHAVLKKGINRQLRILGNFNATKMNIITREIRCRQTHIDKQEKAMKDLEKMRRVMDDLFQTTSRADQFISRASWLEKSAHIDRAIQRAKIAVRDTKEEVRISLNFLRNNDDHSDQEVSDIYDFV